MAERTSSAAEQQQPRVGFIAPRIEVPSTPEAEEDIVERVDTSTSLSSSLRSTSDATDDRPIGALPSLNSSLRSVQSSDTVVGRVPGLGASLGASLASSMRSVQSVAAIGMSLNSSLRSVQSDDDNQAAGYMRVGIRVRPLGNGRGDKDGGLKIDRALGMISHREHKYEFAHIFDQTHDNAALCVAHAMSHAVLILTITHEIPLWRGPPASEPLVLIPRAHDSLSLSLSVVPTAQLPCGRTAARIRRLAGLQRYDLRLWPDWLGQDFHDGRGGQDGRAQ